MNLLNHPIILGTKTLAYGQWAIQRYSGRTGPVQDYIEGIQIVPSRGTPSCTRSALLSLVPSAWTKALGEIPNIQHFNISGFTFEVVKALNEKGYVVDIVNYSTPGIEPRRRYDFFLGHGGNTRSIIDHLPHSAFVMHYASSSYWKEFNRMSQERYDDFCRRRGVPPVRRFVRSLAGTEEGEEQLARRADAAFLSGPRTVATFSGVSRNMALMYLGATVEEDLFVPDRDFDGGRNGFLYVAGTGGNVQKGLDLLIEAFSQLPHLHLYVYCDMEEQIRIAYWKELTRDNIHYIYHYRWAPLRPILKRLLRRINFTITAPINIGPGTAFLGSMGLGLIPVGYVDIEADDANSVLANSPSIEALIDCASRASCKPAMWCRQASLETLNRFQRLHTPQAFGANFKSFLDRLNL